MVTVEAEDRVLRLTSAEARYILLQLARRGRLELDELGELLAARAHEVARLRDQLEALEGEPSLQDGRRNLTPERRADLALRGRYMSLMRAIPKGEQERYRAIRLRDGVEAAIRALEAAAEAAKG